MEPYPTQSGTTQQAYASLRPPTTWAAGPIFPAVADNLSATPADVSPQMLDLLTAQENRKAEEARLERAKIESQAFKPSDV